MTMNATTCGIRNRLNSLAPTVPSSTASATVNSTLKSTLTGLGSGTKSVGSDDPHVPGPTLTTR